MASRWWEELQQQTIEMVCTEHATHPERPGLPLTSLRQGLQLPCPELLDVLLAALGGRGLVAEGAFLRDTKHRRALPVNLQAAGQRVRSLLFARPLDPPSRKELAPDDLSRQALRFLIQTEEATELGEDVVLLSAHFRAATEAVKQFLRKNGPATVSELRQVLGTSRRIVVPLLERLDKQGVTVRQGDRRILK
jgi:selenocysteine-specific elongation factor